MKKRMTLFGHLFLGLGFSLGFPLVVQANWAVIDNANLAQAVQQFEEMKKQYELMKQQFAELEQMKNAMTGSFGMGSILNDLQDQAGRRSIPKTWQEVVALQNEGIYGDKVKHYEKLLPKLDLWLISKDAKNRNRVGYELSKSSTRASFAATESIYNQIEERLKSIEALVEQIDQTPNLKAAMDLNSRIMAETGFISLDLARLNAMQLNLQATLQSRANRSFEIQTEFFSKPQSGSFNFKE